MKKIISITLIAFSFKAFSAGFDCTAVLTPIEKKICNNTEISSLDSQMVEIYKTKVNRNVTVSQRDWIKNVRNISKDDTALITAYKQRIAELKTYSTIKKVNDFKPIDNVDQLTLWCSDSNSPFLTDMNQNASLYKFIDRDQRQRFNKLREKMVNSCVNYLAVNSVDGSKIPNNIDYNAEDHNEKAIETWFSHYKNTLHKDLKNIQDLPKHRSAISKEQTKQGMIFAGATKAADVKVEPISNAEVLSMMCGDKNFAWSNEIRNNRKLYPAYKYSEYAASLDSYYRNKHINSCVAYMAVHSVDGMAPEKAGLDIDVAGMNDAALAAWVDSYKETLRKDYKEMIGKIASRDELHASAKKQGISPAELQYRRDQEEYKAQNQAEADKKVGAEAARQEDLMAGIRRANSEESAKDAAYCAGVFGQLSTKETGLTGATLKGVQDGFVAFSVMSSLIDSPVDRNYSLERGAREARESVSSQDERRLAFIRDYCKLASANFQMRVNNKAIDMVKQNKK